MAEVVAALNALFFGEAAEYGGAFQREMMVRFGTSTSGLLSHVSGTPKYAAFIADRARAEVAHIVISGDKLQSLGDRVAMKAIAAAEDGQPMDRQGLKDAVKATPEYLEYQRERVTMVAQMCERELTEAQMDRLMRIEGVDELRAAIERADESSESDASDSESDASDTESDDALPSTDAAVDDKFMEEFLAEYGRDATVYEYVHVRHLMATKFLTLKAIGELHYAAYTQLEVVHRELLDESLPEAEFCKRYLPQALTDPGLPARQREAVLGSSGYRNSMRERLGALHKTRFGEDITDEEGDYMFERSVLQQRLALQSDRLNGVVDAFAEQTTRLYERVTEMYKGVLGREPEDQEVRTVLMAFRKDQASAEASLRRELVRSLEYREVLRQEIVLAAPGMSVPSVFKTLDAVLKTSRLEDYTAADAVKNALAK
jgi:hypothetical protein